MSRQLEQLRALDLADWFTDDVDDPRCCELNNLDDERTDSCRDPFELVARTEEVRAARRPAGVGRRG